MIAVVVVVAGLVIVITILVITIVVAIVLVVVVVVVVVVVAVVLLHGDDNFGSNNWGMKLWLGSAFVEMRSAKCSSPAETPNFDKIHMKINKVFKHLQAFPHFDCPKRAPRNVFRNISKSFID